MKSSLFVFEEDFFSKNFVSGVDHVDGEDEGGITKRELSIHYLIVPGDNQIYVDHDFSMSGGNIVHLNIGGSRYTTLRETLVTKPVFSKLTRFTCLDLT